MMFMSSCYFGIGMFLASGTSMVRFQTCIFLLQPIEMQHSGASGCFVSRASWFRLKSTLSSALAIEAATYHGRSTKQVEAMAFSAYGLIVISRHLDGFMTRKRKSCPKLNQGFCQVAKMRSASDASLALAVRMAFTKSWRPQGWETRRNFHVCKCGLQVLQALNSLNGDEVWWWPLMRISEHALLALALAIFINWPSYSSTSFPSYCFSMLFWWWLNAQFVL